MYYWIEKRGVGHQVEGEKTARQNCRGVTGKGSKGGAGLQRFGQDRVRERNGTRTSKCRETTMNFPQGYYVQQTGENMK